ncbi:MAG TPA: hypothetical protein VGH22_15230 [Candidatus Binatia bacterium]|jgi:hypothetical protein
MSEKDRFAHRLALLGGVEFSSTDLDIITSEIEDMDRIVTELEQFAHDTAWISLQAQPSEKKSHHD